MGTIVRTKQFKEPARSASGTQSFKKIRQNQSGVKVEAIAALESKPLTEGD
jgi:hypothetical protein